MNERNSVGGDHVDLAIENVIARRAVGGSAGTMPVSPLSTEEELVAELAALTEMEWPADEAGDRITMTVATSPLGTTSDGSATAAAPDRRVRSGAPHHRPARSRWLVAAAVAVAAALGGGTVQLIGGSHGTARHVAGPAAAHGSAPPKAPASLTAMTVVSNPGALGRVGVVENSNAFLTCVTRSVCYVDGMHGGKWTARFVARSVDGGATWTGGATLPVGSSSDTEWNFQVSCLTALHCFSAYASGMVETTDGFAHARFLRITKPSDYVSWVSCPTTQHCVAAVSNNNDRKFVYSDDGGRSWTAATAPSIGYDTVAQMRCDANGACIAALSGGDEENGTAAALSSTNGGRSWVMSATYSLGTEQQYWASCGDAQDCVVGGNFGAVPLAWIHVTASGEISIRIRQLPLQIAGTGISCATARDCFLVAGDTIAVTHDGGYSWTSAPTAPASQGGGATLVNVSCPVAAGCIGLAQSNGHGWAVVSDLQHAR